MQHRVWAAKVVEGGPGATARGNAQEELPDPLLQGFQRLSAQQHQHHPLCTVIVPAC